jgi:hypothetical protein
MIALLLTITVVKLVLASAWGGTADIPQMLDQARSYLAGRDLLDPSSTGGNPSFFPVGHYFLAAACLLASQWTGMTFSFLIRTPAILADLLVSLLLRAMPRGGDRAAVLYMVNPVTFLLSVYHGQLHTVALAGTVLALWLADRGRLELGGVMLGLAASLRQHYSALIIPLVVSAGRRRLTTLVLFALTILLVNVQLLASARPDRILAPTSSHGIWGYTVPLVQGPRILSLLGFSQLGFVPDFLIHTFEVYGIGLSWIWAVVFGLWAWRRNEEDLWRAALLFLLGLYVVGPGFGVQYLVWVVPFWVLVQPLGSVLYSTLAGAYLAGTYWVWGLNAKYGVRSLTANLGLLGAVDLTVILAVGTLGFLTWVYCSAVVWRLALAPGRSSGSL